MLGAAIAMIVQYPQDFPLEDCEALAEYDIRRDPGLCCTPAPFSYMRGGSDSEIVAILVSFGIHGEYLARPLSYSEIIRQIDSKRPIIAILSGGFSGHVVVISGYEQPRIPHVLDPQGRLSDKLEYSDVRSGMNVRQQGFRWRASIRILSKPSDTPMYRRVVQRNEQRARILQYGTDSHAVGTIVEQRYR